MPKDGIEYSAIDELVVEFQYMADNAEQLIAGKMEELRKYLYNETREYLGKYSITQRELDMLDNPYARRHGGAGTPAPMPYIHKQTGDLLEDFLNNAHNTQIHKDGDTLTIEFISNVPYFPHLKYGTVNMVPRDIGSEILEQAQPVIQKELSDLVNIISMKKKGHTL